MGPRRWPGPAPAGQTGTQGPREDTPGTAAGKMEQEGDPWVSGEQPFLPEPQLP